MHSHKINETILEIVTAWNHVLEPANFTKELYHFRILSLSAF